VLPGREDEAGEAQSCERWGREGVAIINTFNDALTRDEETKQALLQVVEHHRRLHPFK